MKFSLPILLSLLSVVMADQAPKNNDNSKGVIAIADFPRGNVIFYVKKGNQVKVHVDMTDLPTSGGPFQYHIHENPVPADNNCEAVGLHFNPFSAPPDCDGQPDDSWCQVGDLSGKHGWIDATCFETKYYDPYLSLEVGNPAYIVGKSVTFHFANLTKFACATIELVSDTRRASLFDYLSSRGDLELQTLGTDQEQEDDTDYEVKSPPGSTPTSTTTSSVPALKSQVLQQNPTGGLKLNPSEIEYLNRTNSSATSSNIYDGTDINEGNNITNASYASVVSTDCENNAAFVESSIFTFGAALIAGLLM
ncbi:cell surface superoxide dismutase [Cu-Zn] 6 [[Candida] anglica]|uniref:Cell surface superoxide dismutase [Cu-Zn] 6 n=1 Tax=[Candida] anglica TaxID=148631 RepID=A0ABP0EER6_9ASCO